MCCVQHGHPEDVEDLLRLQALVDEVVSEAPRVKKQRVGCCQGSMQMTVSNEMTLLLISTVSSLRSAADANGVMMLQLIVG